MGGATNELTVVRDGAEMVRQMRPERVAGRFVFRALAPDAVAARLPEIRGLFVEAEGLSAILPATRTDRDAMAQITLQVRSALDGVGLTAAVSTALAGAGIPCNMVAGLRHDHLFVPETRADEALDILRRLSGSDSEKG
ncbi:MAG: ACT domain-containing protein [Rhodobacteraceae bacterium]|jgi:hypothetical protein|nr:ACT domain-containing protein [Paracoccaceae bacterium]